MPGYVLAVVVPSAVVLILGILAIRKCHPDDVAPVLRALLGRRD